MSLFSSLDNYVHRYRQVTQLCIWTSSRYYEDDAIAPTLGVSHHRTARHEL